MRYLAIVFILVLPLPTLSIQAAAGDKIGVVLMHAKNATAREKSPTGKLAYALGVAGFIVVAPDMPWSRSRGFDRTYAESMAEIDQAVAGLKVKGATKIVVGGHSIGANAALGYGARREGLAGILAIAPGHNIDSDGFQKLVDHDYRRAKKMVAAGKGDEETGFKDVNQGRKSSKDMKAKVYLSWFDPEGPAPMPKNAANLKPGTALMWIIGEKDRLMMNRGKDYAFAKAPAHDKSAYVVVKGGHRATPTKGKKEIIAWLKGL
jgi:pimeloyl-ACP methyl ester carboxylesterase